MLRKFIYISIFALLLQTNLVTAGTTGSEELKDASSQNTTGECVEGFSRAMFKFNHALDGAISEWPIIFFFLILYFLIRLLQIFVKLNNCFFLKFV